MRAPSLCAAVALATSCFSRPPVAIEAPEAVIYASERNHEQACASLEVVRVYRPIVEGILDAACERPAIVLLDHELIGVKAGYTTHDDEGRLGDITLGTDGLRFLRPVLVHELVHWIAFGSVWRRLPILLHEGLAYLLQVQLVEAVGKTVTIASPTAKELRIVLSSTRAHYHQEASKDLHTAAGWVVGKLGLPELRKLAEQAESAGLELVPAAWLEAAIEGSLGEPAELPPVELLELVLYDEQGTIVQTAILNARESSSSNRLTPGAARFELREFELPPYDGPRSLVKEAQSRSEKGVKSVP